MISRAVAFTYGIPDHVFDKCSKKAMSETMIILGIFDERKERRIKLENAMAEMSRGMKW